MKVLSLCFFLINILCPILFAGTREEVASRSGLWMRWLREKPGQWPMTRYYQKRPELLDRWADSKPSSRTRIGERKMEGYSERFPMVDSKGPNPEVWRREVDGGVPNYSFSRDRRYRKSNLPGYRHAPDYVYYYNCYVSPWTDRYPPRVLFRRRQSDVRYEEVRSDMAGRFSNTWKSH
jgi:hypothetical protein